ncbi:complexin-2 [Eubacterium ventriosum]|uniref:Complexin-2 n=1 Tax=Eubacterium ventriosum TaxID=39496 RepID=A0A414RAS9_9FIRM|nr:complexin-2 [Eubacterium ventriosum]RHF90162.1 complexin-2 [Eubacterium ventriosum]
MNKNRKITNELMVALIKYHVLNMRDDEEMNKYIVSELEKKLKRMGNHDTYTKSKTASTEEEREEARQDYPDAVGMHPDFRW